jgi:hypothetical protein
MSLTLDEIKAKYQLFNEVQINDKDSQKYIHTIFKNNDLFLLDKMKRANLYEPSLIKAFQNKTIYPDLMGCYFELLEPALELIIQNKVDIDYAQLFVSLLQNEDKRCMFTFFEKFSEEINTINFQERQKYSLKYLMTLRSDRFQFFIDLFERENSFFKFYQDNFVQLAFKELDFESHSYQNILTNIQLFIKKGFSVENYSSMSYLLLDWIDKNAQDTMDSQKRDFYDSIYREEGKKFVADLNTVFDENHMELLKQLFLVYQKEGALDVAFIERYKEDMDYFKELGLDYSYYDKDGLYHEGNFLLNCEKALLENQIESNNTSSKKIKI